jgi:hypothetical protein
MSSIHEASDSRQDSNVFSNKDIENSFTSSQEAAPVQSKNHAKRVAESDWYSFSQQSK